MDYEKKKRYQSNFIETEMRVKIKIQFRDPSKGVDRVYYLPIAGINIGLAGLSDKRKFEIKTFDDLAISSTFPHVKKLYRCFVALEEELGRDKLNKILTKHIFPGIKNPVVSFSEKKRKNLTTLINNLGFYLSKEARKFLHIQGTKVKLIHQTEEGTLLDEYEDEWLKATFKYLKDTALIIWKHNYKIVINEFPSMRWYKELEKVRSFKQNKIYKQIEKYSKVMDILVSIVGEESLEEAINKMDVKRKRKIYYSYQEFITLITKIENSVKPGGFNKEIASIVEKNEKNLNKTNTDNEVKKLQEQKVVTEKNTKTDKVILNQKQNEVYNTNTIKSKTENIQQLPNNQENLHTLIHKPQPAVSNKKETPKKDYTQTKGLPKKNVSTTEVLSLGTDEPIRTERKVMITQRNQALSQKLKSLYGHRCQVCGERIQVGINEYLSESHHIQPVGGEHQGPDIAENMIILCPNHHAMFDRGAVKIDLQKRKIIHIDVKNPIHNAPLTLKHEIKDVYVDYHNSFRYQGKKQKSQPNNNEEKNWNYDCKIIIQDSDGEQHEFNLPNKYNKHFMNDIERKLLQVEEGNIIEYMGFTYTVEKIEEKPN